MTALSLADVYQARRRLGGRVRRTPLVHSPALSQLAGAPVHLKMESHQLTGSFKLRGAVNAIGNLDEAQRKCGVVTASTGNHGRAVAYAARQRDMRAVVCLSSLVPRNKIQAIRDLGAEVCIEGNSQDDALARAGRFVAEDGLVMVPPFDHPDVIAGQGTIGLEILEQLPETGSVLVPLSGGGLLSGIALAVKAARPAMTVVGITMANGCAMHASLRAGRPVLVDETPSLADSLGGGIGLDNRLTFSMVRDLCDRTCLTSEAAIAAAIVHMYRHEREVVEGAAAVGVAALMEGLVGDLAAHGPMVLIVSGRNIDMARHLDLLARSVSPSS